MTKRTGSRGNRRLGRTNSPMRAAASVLTALTIMVVGAVPAAALTRGAPGQSVPGQAGQAPGSDASTDDPGASPENGPSGQNGSGPPPRPPAPGGDVGGEEPPEVLADSTPTQESPLEITLGLETSGQDATAHLDLVRPQYLPTATRSTWATVR